LESKLKRVLCVAEKEIRKELVWRNV